MNFDFDTVIDRRDTGSSKWQKFAPDVLPFWVADMDFAAPHFILEALRERLQHPILGYTNRPESLTRAFQDWLQFHFQWQVPAEWVVWIPGVVPGLNLATQTLEPGQHIIMPTPVYHPFLALAQHAGLQQSLLPMQSSRQSASHWRMDFAAMQAAVQAESRMLLICNPQNPTGRCYGRDELAELADFVEHHNLLLVSDEIHANVILDPDSRHIPIAREFPQLAPRTISLFAASKIYNIPGLSCAAAVIPDAHLRAQFQQARKGLVAGIGPLGFVAAEAALRDRSTWISELQDYLRANLALLHDCVGDRLTPLQGTYLAWIDVSDMGLAEDAQASESYFAKHGLGISPGAQFGQPGYIRFNFGCPRTTLQVGLERLAQCLP